MRPTQVMPPSTSQYQELLSTPLPQAVKQCNSTYQLFKKYLLNPPPSINKARDDKTKLSILTYLFAIQLTQMLMAQYELPSLTDLDKAIVLTVLNNIISILESIKTKQLKIDNKPSLFRKFGGGSNTNNKAKFSDVINDDEKSRLFLNEWCLGKLNEIKKVFNDGLVNGDTVDLLVDCSVGLQVSLGLFPYDNKELKSLENEIKKEEKESIKEVVELKEEVNEDGDIDSSSKVEGSNDKEEENINNSEEIDIKKESEYFENKLKLAENEISMPIVEQVTLPKEDHNEEEEEEDSMTKDDILAKIKWCNYHISRIIGCFKEGKDPNEDFTGLFTQPSSKEDSKISQHEIDAVIREALEMRDVSDNDSDKFREEDYYYDSDEGEYIHKNSLKEMQSKFPDTPDSHPNSLPSSLDKETTSGPPSDEKRLPKPRRMPFQKKQTAADLIARKASLSNKTPTKPIDLKTLEKQLSNSELLNSASKCCKFAMSAINYEDTTTAIAELREAMKLLEQYQNKTENPSDPL